MGAVKKDTLIFRDGILWVMNLCLEVVALFLYDLLYQFVDLRAGYAARFSRLTLKSSEIRETPCVFAIGQVFLNNRMSRVLLSILAVHSWNYKTGCNHC